MRKCMAVLLTLLLVGTLAAIPFLCVHCSLLPEQATAYYEQKARKEAAADDSPEAQLMRMLLGGVAEEEATEAEPSHPAFSHYGLSLSAGALLACCAVFGEWKLKKQKKSLLFPLFVAVSLVVPLGLLGSRLIYCTVNAGFYLHDIQSPSAMLRIWEGGLSLAGALSFAAMGGWIAAKVCKAPVRQVLDILAPALVLFACWAYMSEKWIHAGYGPEGGFPLTAVQGEMRMDTALITCLVLLFLALLQKDFPRTAFLYGSVMILLESLRRDGHMVWGFVHAEQIFALCMALPALMYFAVKIRRGWLALCTTALMAGIVIALEFALDRSPISDALLYGVYALVIAGYMALGLLWAKRAQKE